MAALTATAAMAAMAALAALTATAARAAMAAPPQFIPGQKKSTPKKIGPKKKLSFDFFWIS